MIFTDDPDTPCQECPADQPASPDALKCGTCAPGSRRSDDLVSCELCRAGSYSGEDDFELQCTTCEVGTYGTEEGATECTTCPAEHTSGAGSTSADDCLELISCEPGTEPTQDLDDPCACDLDGIVDGVDTGRAGCGYHGFGFQFCHVSSACESTSAYMGSTKRKDCDAVTDNLPATCESCVPGKYSADGLYCALCPEGNSSATGANECSFCPAA
jgi:hypothetical protein